MKTKNELFLEAVDYLIDEGLATDQGDVTQKAGLGPNLISRVRNGRVKSVSNDSIRALVSRFNLNMDYFRGKSDYITRYDQLNAKADRDLEEAQRLLNKDPLSPSPQPIDNSSLVNAALAAKDETIDALRSQLEEKDTIIASKDETIQLLRQQLAQYKLMKENMESAVASIEDMKGQMAMMMSQYSAPQPTFPMAVNDDGSLKFVIHDVIGLDGKSKKKSVDQLYALVPQGLIHGGHPSVTDEIVRKATEAFKKKK